MTIADPRRAIFLVGFMGSGKTTVGRLLAEWLAREFVDLDEAVEAGAGMSIARIFAERGETWFRALESSILGEIVGSAAAQDRPEHAQDRAGRGPDRVDDAAPILAALPHGAAGRVVACGGGTICIPENAALMKGEGTTVWLDQPFDRIWLRRKALAGSRPLFGTQAELRALYERRRPFYAGADLRIEVGEDAIEKAVDDLLRALHERSVVD